jgi:hypothetical protein
MNSISPLVNLAQKTPKGEELKFKGIPEMDNCLTTPRESE